MISVGGNSADEAFLECPVKAMARAFALGLMVPLVGVPGEANPDAVPEPLWSEAADILRSPNGTVKFSTLVVVVHLLLV
ncbi:hypothetical protein HC256_010425 [Beauveria bassiana]|nr:hypothetical protein HC256_010425 [Beauveria bassiana]